MDLTVEGKKLLIDSKHSKLSIKRQCELLGLPRSSYYYASQADSSVNNRLKKLVDEEYVRRPFYGSRRMTKVLHNAGYQVNRKRVIRLMNELGLQAIYPRRRLSFSNKKHKKYPYLLGDIKVVRPNQVWSSDITYIRVNGSYVYLTAVLDLYSRFVLSWRLSNTLDKDFCLEALEAALKQGRPKIFNTDQGTQFTSEEFVGKLESNGVQVSMDGKGRVFDNIFIERLWRSVKYEDVYLKNYSSVRDAIENLREYFEFYNYERPHQSLDYKTPADMHGATINVARAGNSGRPTASLHPRRYERRSADFN